MNIDVDVANIARAFGIDPVLLQAVVRAEGNIIRAVQCSFPFVSTRAQALQITARSAVHAMCDWIRSGGAERQADFVSFWAERWAPVGAKNDARNLNVNWTTNVERLWKEGNV